MSKKIRLTAALVLCASMCLTSLPCQAQESKPTASARPVINGGLPHVSPDGKLIAFVSNRGGATDLYVIAGNGRDEKQLTQTPESESLAGWTRDGKQILFSTTANDVSTLYEIKSDGTNQREIAKFPGRGPMPSPDGASVIYMSGTWTATRLMVSRIDGTQPKQITDGSSIAWNTHWSPDSKRLAFTGRTAPDAPLAIFVVNNDGSGLRQLTRIAAEEGGAQWPVWSPDGKRIAVQVNNRVTRTNAFIWVVDVGTGDARKLGTHDSAYLDETPSWFPNGKHVAFQSNRTGRMEVWTMKVDGSDPQQVTH